MCAYKIEIISEKDYLFLNVFHAWNILFIVTEATPIKIL